MSNKRTSPRATSSFEHRLEFEPKRRATLDQNCEYYAALERGGVGEPERREYYCRGV